MSEPFIGEVRGFTFGFTPEGWAKCEGQILPIAQFTALFSLLGTTYGGNGETSFGLPDLRGRLLMSVGDAGNLTARSLGQTGGSERVVLDIDELPTHSHALHASTESANDDKSDNNELASGVFYHSPTTDSIMSSTAIANAGEGGSHENMPPFIALNYCIALTGVYPSRDD